MRKICLLSIFPGNSCNAKRKPIESLHICLKCISSLLSRLFKSDFSYFVNFLQNLCHLYIEREHLPLLNLFLHFSFIFPRSLPANIHCHKPFSICQLPLRNIHSCFVLSGKDPFLFFLFSLLFSFGSRFVSS